MGVAPFLIFFLILILVIFGTALWAGIVGAPFSPSRLRDRERILRLAKIKDRELVYDLGSGDGRMVLTVARKTGALVIGYEISLLPYLISRLVIWLGGVAGQAKIIYGDFFQKNLQEADVIFCYLTPKAMEILRDKFKKEAKRGCRIISYCFAIKGWTPKAFSQPQKNDVPIYLYER